jgi:hypothetical protein
MTRRSAWVGGEIVEHLDQRVLDVGQRARRYQPVHRAGLGLRLHFATRRAEHGLQMRQRILAQLRGIGRGMRQRGEIAPQRVTVQEVQNCTRLDAQHDLRRSAHGSAKRPALRALLNVSTVQR